MIKLTAKHYVNIVESTRREWPKYSTQLLNLASQNCKATSPKNVGSVKELWLAMRKNGIPGTLQNWINYYNTVYGQDRLIEAGSKIHLMLKKMNITGITLEMCIDYAMEVVYNKTHMGLGGEEMAIEAVAKFFKLSFKFSSREEESIGIDGWIGNKPVQVKPHNSAFKSHVHNHPDTDKILLITYEEKKSVCYIHNPEFITK